MSALERALGSVGLLITLALLLGLMRRGHWRSLPIFTAFMVGQLVTQAPMAWDPVRFYRWDFWLFHETATAALRFGVALELAHRIFRGFPGAAASALNAVLGVIIVTAVGVVGMYSPDASYSDILTRIVPGIAHGTAWVFTILATLTLWYRIPLAPLAKVILMGYTPYLIVFTAGHALLGEMGWGLRQEVGFALVIAFLALKVYWTWAAWTFPATQLVLQRMPAPAPQTASAA